MREHSQSAGQTNERSGPVDVHRDAWQQTLRDMKSIETEHEDAGRIVVRVVADDTALEPPSAGKPDRYGIVHVIPGNHATKVASVVENTTFSTYNVYQATAGERVFFITELLDPNAETAIVIAATYKKNQAGPFYEILSEQEQIYTYLQKVDGTVMAAFTHEEPEKFFPE